MTGAQAVLPFTEQMPAGLDFSPDVITAEEEIALAAEIDALDLPHFVFQRWTSRRRTRSFGYTYDFRESSFTVGEPIPTFLLPVKERAAAFAGVEDRSLVQASVIRYEPGAGIGWHKDRPELGTVIGISLGSATKMRFRCRAAGETRRASKLLPARSIYHLAGDVRYDWEHSIPPGQQLRWSITFRGLTDLGRTRVGDASHATVVTPAST